MSGEFDIVVAIDRDRGIARAGQIPWRLPGDVAHFKTLTRTTRASGTRNAVVMGRKTWDSIPDRLRPLLGRKNAVLTRQHQLEVPGGVMCASSLDRALAGLRIEQAHGDRPIERIFVIGGSEIYAEAVGKLGCRTIYLTRVDGSFDCDRFFPPFERDYQLIEVVCKERENGLAYGIEVWQRHGRRGRRARSRQGQPV
ncbi:MAG: dihydrofolate reductase [Proteobacteria bacterium]|nr:dihydrofolate reductase [Pseudomonadota bacterium]